MVRKRRPHRTARDRLRSFGLSRFRYLWFIPALILVIIAVASVRVPRTATAWLQQSQLLSESALADVSIRTGKYRTSIPGGYRLAVDLSWRAYAQEDALAVELILRDEGGEAVATQSTAIGAGELNVDAPVTRAELDIPYNLSGKYQLSVRVTGVDDKPVQDETPLGPLNVY
jgi:hypothetical protein